MNTLIRTHTYSNSLCSALIIKGKQLNHKSYLKMGSRISPFRGMVAPRTVEPCVGYGRTAERVLALNGCKLHSS